jgi:hypothetical protein
MIAVTVQAGTLARRLAAIFAALARRGARHPHLRPRATQMTPVRAHILPPRQARPHRRSRQ